jgi:tripartite ATP-independent transporter DctP family solute receptor
MKRLLLSSVAGALAFGLLLLPAENASAEVLKLRISGENPATGYDLVMAQKFADLMKEALGADFEYELFHTQALGDEVVHMQQIRTGQIDIYPMGSDAVDLDNGWAVFDMPFLFADRDAVAKLLDGEVGEELRKSMRAKAGLEVLAFGELGFRQITNNIRPVVKPEDLNGIRLRTPGSETRILAFQMLGADPQEMNLGEVYLALQQGTLDGQENPLTTIKTRSFFEVNKYLSLSSHVYTPVTMVMNGAKYDSLTPELQALVKAKALEAAKYTRELGTQADATLVDELKQHMEVNEIDHAAFAEKAKPIWEKIGEIAGPELTAKVVAAASQ